MLLQSRFLNRLNSSNFVKYMQKYIGDWILVFSLISLLAYLQFYTQPFHRHFSINDPTINFPFAQKQQFPDDRLFRFCILYPLLVMSAVQCVKFVRLYKNTNKSESRSELISKTLHNYHILVLAFIVGLAINGLVTEFLKNLISKPRPDFIERCGVNYDMIKPNTVNYDSSICTKPLGLELFKDGFKSSPSGHSSFAFTGLGFFALWLLGQLKLFAKSDQSTGNALTRLTYKPVYIRLIPLIPVLIACKIAISRTQDYRHHFKDILLGSCLGIINCYFNYFWFFNNLDDKRSDSIIHEDDYQLLMGNNGYQLESRNLESIV